MPKYFIVRQEQGGKTVGELPDVKLVHEGLLRVNNPPPNCPPHFEVEMERGVPLGEPIAEADAVKYRPGTLLMKGDSPNARGYLVLQARPGDNMEITSPTEPSAGETQKPSPLNGVERNLVGDILDRFIRGSWDQEAATRTRVFEALGKDNRRDMMAAIRRLPVNERDDAAQLHMVMEDLRGEGRFRMPDEVSLARDIEGSIRVVTRR